MNNLAPFAVERKIMAATVNLDALIPREDFVAGDVAAGGQPRQTLSISDLAENGFFQNSLRKPDFQRETTHWSPSKVVDLIRAFLDRDLIPAVILWERGDEVFVIDGAHRLSALIAWIRDDYGDRRDSNSFFGSGPTEEQRKIAERTRKEVKKEIGTYAEFRGLVGQSVHDETMARRLSAIGKNSMVIQWVTAATAKAAEESFFKINQAAQPIDPVERRILQTRSSPNAIASRCIARGGKGHKYWAGFALQIQENVEGLGVEINDILYRPPHSQPVTSSDVPIAGQGYNALPFVFNLVSLANGLKIPNSFTNKKIEAPLPPDEEGHDTIRFLENVKRRLQLVSTNHSGSLGFHPLVFYYARSGVFLPNSFLASLEFAKRLDDQGKKNDFTKVRREFERYIHENKLFVSLTLNRLGSGARSLNRITDLYWSVFKGLSSGKSDDEIFQAFIERDDFVHLKQAHVPAPSFDHKPSRRGASKETRSAAFIREALANPMRCSICGGAIHANSVTFDHSQRRSEGGDNQSDNIAPTHPYCNSGYKG